MLIYENERRMVLLYADIIGLNKNILFVPFRRKMQATFSMVCDKYYLN
jgi:hypothetical protein